MLRIAAIFYAAMAAFALAINAIRGAPLVPLAVTPRLAPALVAAALVALATILLSAYGSRRWAFARALEATFRKTLGALSLKECVLLGLASGTAEEMLFRGAVQPALGRLFGSELLGMLAATAAFGALHTGPERALRVWTVFALALGLFFGYVTLLCQSILPAALCHVAINAVNLYRIAGGPPPPSALQTRSLKAEG